MGRKPCCSKVGLNRGAWTAMEDKILSDYIKDHGEGKWSNVPKKAGLKRCGKSCRLRWLNYLRPDIKRGNITNDEEELIIRLHKLLGNRWSLIAGRLPGRTDNEIKNYWNTNIGKKLQNQQIPSSRHELLKPNPTIQGPKANPSLVNADANVIIRTKATRCSKVVIPPELQIDDQQQLAVAPKPQQVAQSASMVHASNMDDKSLPESSSHNFTSEEENLSNLMLDFEMDEQVLSDLLNTDFSQLISDLDNEAASDTNSCDQGHSTPNSDHTHLFSEDTRNDFDFPWMASLIDSEFDWLQDSGRKTNT